MHAASWPCPGCDTAVGGRTPLSLQHVDPKNEAVEQREAAPELGLQALRDREVRRGVEHVARPGCQRAVRAGCGGAISASVEASLDEIRVERVGGVLQRAPTAKKAPHPIHLAPPAQVPWRGVEHLAGAGRHANPADEPGAQVYGSHGTTPLGGGMEQVEGGSGAVEPGAEPAPAWGASHPAPWSEPGL